jgi:uncharacterized protein YegL
MDFAAYSIATPAPKIFLKIRGHPLTTRQPVHFIAVLDTSGSMGANNRLTNCLDSLRFLTRFLTATDRLSLITFSSHAEIAMKAVHMNTGAIAQLEHTLAHCVAMGGTNMSAAINCIQECVQAAPDATKTDVLFLTDGQANEGVVAIPALLQMLRTKLQEHPTVTVSTIGYSTDHNADLLRALAEQNAGSYNVVVDREGVASVFGVLLGGLMSCVGANLQITAPADTICLPANLRVTPGAAGAGSSICVGDVYADAETQIVLSVGAAPAILPITGYDVTIAEDFTALVTVAPATAEIEEEATIFELRQEVAALLRRCGAAATEPVDTLLAAVAILRQRLLGRTDAVSAMLLQTLTETEEVLRANNLNNQTRVLFAQNSAYTQMGRGLRATVSAASTVHDDPIHLNATRSAIDEDPFASPMMRMVAGVTQALSVAAAVDPPAFGVQQGQTLGVQRQEARYFTNEEINELNTTFADMIGETPAPAEPSHLQTPPPIHRIQYATTLFSATTAAVAAPPTSPLLRQVAAPSRQTSNVSEGSVLPPQRLGFQSPDMSPIFGSQAPINIPMIALSSLNAAPKPA